MWLTFELCTASSIDSIGKQTLVKFTWEKTSVSVERQGWAVRFLFLEYHNAAEIHWRLVNTLGKKALSERFKNRDWSVKNQTPIPEEQKRITAVEEDFHEKKSLESKVCVGEDWNPTCNVS